MPETVKYGISNLTVMGARFSKSCSERIKRVKVKLTENETRTTFHTGKSKVRTHQELATPTQLLDLPYERRFVRCILYRSCRRLTNLVKHEKP